MVQLMFCARAQSQVVRRMTAGTKFTLQSAQAYFYTRQGVVPEVFEILCSYWSYSREVSGQYQCLVSSLQFRKDVIPCIGRQAERDPIVATLVHCSRSLLPQSFLALVFRRVSVSAAQCSLTQGRLLDELASTGRTLIHRSHQQSMGLAATTATLSLDAAPRGLRSGRRSWPVWKRLRPAVQHVLNSYPVLH